MLCFHCVLISRICVRSDRIDRVLSCRSHASRAPLPRTYIYSRQSSKLVTLKSSRVIRPTSLPLIVASLRDIDTLSR
jgi:hypothetical protein